jgi:hypothetical protein
VRTWPKNRFHPTTGAALLAIVAGASAIAATACNAILGLGDYAVGRVDAGMNTGADASGVDASSGDPDSAVIFAPDASTATDAQAAPDAPNCDADPRVHCYACAPTTSAQFANACTNSTCVPFDDTRLTNLLLDGALPPVPWKDASSD